MTPPPATRNRRVVSATSSSRFESRTRRRRLRLVLRVIALVLALAAVGGAVWLVGWSDVLALRAVRIEGVKAAPLADEIRTVADAPVGRPLVRVDLAAIADRVSTVEDVKSVDVSRSWPSGLVITVKPRTPAAMIEDDGRWRYLDASGAVFGTVGVRPKELMVIDALTRDSAQDVRAAAVEVARALPADLRIRVERIEARRVSDIRLMLGGGAEVVWGGSDRSERKAEVLAALMKHKAKVYDVSAPERPAIKA